ncbi:hypothetical protein HYQ44_017958 [Verticillium longisporum]|nr:hypothetical protein HYQ44_017958 [Verticillium longisporum]
MLGGLCQVPRPPLGMMEVKPASDHVHLKKALDAVEAFENELVACIQLDAGFSESPQGDLGKEVPKVIPSNRFLFFSLEATGKSDVLFKLDHPRVREIQLCQQVALEEERIPVNALGQLPLIGRYPVR